MDGEQTVAGDTLTPNRPSMTTTPPHDHLVLAILTPLGILTLPSRFAQKDE